jgi:hypothetical protein
MFRIVLAALLLGSLALIAPAATAAPPPAKQVFKGTIKDVRGIEGTLTLALEDKEAKDRTFQIQEARIVGLGGSEWKVGDLQEGDRVEVEMAAGGKMVQEVRVVKRPKVR